MIKTQRTLACCVFVLIGMMIWSVSTIAQNKDIEHSKRSTWQMDLKLDTPNLVPPAVQWTILDKDPVPGFGARVKKMQKHYKKHLEQAKNKVSKEIICSSQMMISWDLGFKGVTGDNVYLLTSAQDVAHSFQSNAPDGKKWIVTKTVMIKGKPVCWCLPIKVKFGKEIEITLTENNTLDLDSLYDDAMRKPDE